MTNQNPLKTRLLWLSFAVLAPLGLCKDDSSGVSGYAYSKPDFQDGSRLLFLGDSITDMKWGRNEKDRNHYLGHNQLAVDYDAIHIRTHVKARAHLLESAPVLAPALR